MKPEYSAHQLRVLWYIKRHNPLVQIKHESLITMMSGDLNIRPSTLRAILKELEDRSLVCRTYGKGTPETFAEARGNPLIRIELVDPKMYLPDPPKPLPTVVIDAMENEEMYERTRQIPSSEETIIALLERNEELQCQLEKLQDIIQQLTRQQAETRRPIPEHLTQRIRSALTPEQWDQLSHRNKR